MKIILVGLYQIREDLLLIKMLVTYGISRSYLADVTAAELLWHMSNKAVI